MAISPSPIVDGIFIELANKLETCSIKRLRGCCDCPILEECQKKWSALSEKAMRRYLRETDKEWFMQWFGNLHLV